jgi:hypothetical protein
MSYNEVMDARTALTCAHLNLRCGKRCLQKGLTTKGVAALYDSVLFGMHYCLDKHSAFARQNIQLWDAASMFQALTRIGLFVDSLTFNRFNLIVERALWHGFISPDSEPVLTEVEGLLMTLGVIPLKKKPDEEKRNIKNDTDRKKVMLTRKWID